jgi:hypothetical protein
LNASLEGAEARAAEPWRVPRFLSCLVKGPLGCLAFALGAAAVLVLLLPPALGRVLDRFLEDWFAERHAGHLELGDAWLGSFYDSQRIERVILRDPSGDEILRGTFHAPALSEVFDDSTDFGPVVLRIELLHLVEGADGTTNLERALAPPGDRRDSRSGLSTDVELGFDLRLSIARLRTTSARGRTTELAGLDFRGTFEWGPAGMRLELEGGSDEDLAEPLHLRTELRHSEGGRRQGWQGELALANAPTALARSLCAPLRTIALLAGPETDELSWSRDGAEVALRVVDEGGRFELVGEEQDGLVVGARDAMLAATFPCGNQTGQALLAVLLPLVDALECLGPEQSHELTLADYRWPLDGDWSQLSGELELALAPVHAATVGEFHGLGALSSLTEPTVLELVLRDGIVHYSGLELAFERGRLRIDGTRQLASGATELLLSGERGGEPLEPVRLVGAGDELVPVMPDPPLAAEAPEPPGRDE